MSFCNRFVLPVVAVLSLTFLIACGSSSNKATPPPNGGFSNSNLSGTYVFAASGTDVNGVFIAIAGTFTASGGAITGGTMDVNDPLLGLLSAEAITGGSYNVGVDGRPASGSGVLNLQTAAAVFTFDYVLTSSDHGLITYFDTNSNSGGTGSGTLDLQSSVSQSNIDGQSYAFNFSGIGSFNSTTGAQTPFATAGAFTLDANGQIGVTTTGVEDFNDNGSSVCNESMGCQITAGSVNLATVPGTATLQSSSGTFHFDVYPVDATHFKFIETDSVPVTAGDAFTQSSSIPTGNNVFTLSGFDSGLGGPFTAAGILDTDGGGNIKSDSVEDINDNGTAAEIGSITSTGPIGGTYTALSGGRSLVTLTGLVNGNNGLGCSSCVFAAYPSTGGTQLLEIDNGGTTDGIAYAQGASPTLASAEGYGMNLSGFNFVAGVEEDDIAEFTNNSGNLTGLIDLNDDGSTNFDQKFDNSYTADATVSGRGLVNPAGSSFSLVTYGIDSSSTVFVETDANQVALGSLVTQNASAKSDAAARHLIVMRALKANAKKAKKPQ